MSENIIESLTFYCPRCKAVIIPDLETAQTYLDIFEDVDKARRELIIEHYLKEHTTYPPRNWVKWLNRGEKFFLKKLLKEASMYRLTETQQKALKKTISKLKKRALKRAYDYYRYLAFSLADRDGVL